MADAGAAGPVDDRFGDPLERQIDIAIAQIAGDVGQARPEDEGVDALIQINAEVVDCLYSEKLEEFFNKMKADSQGKRQDGMLEQDRGAPPTGAGWADRFGPGTRVPTLIVSPFAKRGHIDKTSYDTTSILKLITRRFGLEPLPGVRDKMGDLTNALEL